MRRGDMYFALDCEMVGVGPEGLDSALARVSIVNWDGQIVLDTYVRVDEPVTDYRTFISGIKEEHVTSDRAMPLDYVQNLVAGILRGKILIGHGLENDLKALCLNHPWTDIRDTAKYAPFMTKVETSSILSLVDAPELRPRKLKDLAYEKLGMEIQVMGVPHSPLEDAKAAMALYKSVRSEWEKEIAKAVSQSYQDNMRLHTFDQNPIDTYPSLSIQSPYSTPQQPMPIQPFIEDCNIHISPRVSMKLFEPKRNYEFVLQPTSPHKLCFTHTNK
jgi:RNA exonuclease 4